MSDLKSNAVAWWESLVTVKSEHRPADKVVTVCKCNTCKAKVPGGGFCLACTKFMLDAVKAFNPKGTQ